MAKATNPIPIGLDEVILVCDRAGMTDAETYRRAFVVAGFRGDVDDITRRRLDLRADLVRMWLSETLAVADVNREDLETLRDVRQALYFKATGKDPITLEAKRTPSESAARELREVIAMRRQILRIDEPGHAGGVGGARSVTFHTMTDVEVAAARAKAAEHDQIAAEIEPAALDEHVDDGDDDAQQLTGDVAIDAARRQYGLK